MHSSFMTTALQFSKVLKNYEKFVMLVYSSVIKYNFDVALWLRS